GALRDVVQGPPQGRPARPAPQAADYADPVGAAGPPVTAPEFAAAPLDTGPAIDQTCHHLALPDSHGDSATTKAGGFPLSSHTGGGTGQRAVGSPGPTPGAIFPLGWGATPPRWAAAGGAPPRCSSTSAWPTSTACSTWRATTPPAATTSPAGRARRAR